MPLQIADDTWQTETRFRFVPNYFEVVYFTCTTYVSTVELHAGE